MKITALLPSLIAAPANYFDDPAPPVRRLAIAAWQADANDVAGVQAVADRLGGDDDETVRAAAAEKLGEVGGPVAIGALIAATDDASPVVVEAVATALGELGELSAMEWLLETAANHADKLIRESAVAALGAIGDPRAVAPLVEVMATGPPQVRRRAVVAASVFLSGPHSAAVEAAITAALDDRNPSVREAAEMVVGRPIDGEQLLQLGKNC